MEKLFLIKYGELSLKKGNQKLFINRLKNNLKFKLQGIKTVITHKFGRFYLEYEGDHKEKILQVLKNCFGIVGYAEAYRVKKDIEAIEEAVLLIADDLMKKQEGEHFKIDCRRIDKSFPLSSYEMACRLGGIILDKYSTLKVKMKNTDWRISVEIRERVYVYGKEYRGQSGLPVGSAGKGLLLLSGGIDSPIAGYLLGKRGLKIDAVYFHTPPYTSDQVLEKVKQLGKTLSNYFYYFHLYVVDFSELQIKIKQDAQNNEVTLHSRACMMKIADKIAKQYGAKCLITGESLSQVASQTAESLRYTGSTTDLPVFRPLIGMDKEQIIEIARKIDTYETSTLPHPDCCVLFAPDHPLIKPDFEKIKAAFTDLNLEELIEETMNKIEIIDFK